MANPHVRQDIWMLEEQQPWHPITLAYALAVREMQERSRRDPDDPTGWEYQAAVHGTSLNPDQWRNQCQHFSWFFLPWHRLYLYWFEQVARSIIQDLEEVDDQTKEDWALPYWNYDRGGTTNTLPLAFRETKLPGGDDNPLFVEQRNQGQFFGPDINEGDGLPDGRDGGPSATTARFALRETRFSFPDQVGLPGGFGGAQTGWHHGTATGTPGELEQTPHNDVHGLVGGPDGFMSAFDTAPLDPIFWLHHANIDRLWAVWLTQPDRANPTDPRWLDQEFHFHDERGNDVVRTPKDALDEAADLGYRYADVSLPATPLEAVAMPSEPPADRPAELVGATEEPVELAGHLATVRFRVSRPAGPLSEAGGTPSRVYLNVEDVQGERNPGFSYAVYANVPDEDDDPTNDAHYVGNISFFGIELAQDLDRDHSGGGGHGGLRHVFDITELYTRLRDEGRWNEDQVTVTFAPLGRQPSRRAGPAGAEAEAAGAPPVTIGRVSLFYQ